MRAVFCVWRAGHLIAAYLFGILLADIFGAVLANAFALRKENCSDLAWWL